MDGTWNEFGCLFIKAHMNLENRDIQTGNVIRRLRREKGLSQTELAEELGVTKNTISAIELGNQTPRGGLLKRIADFFGFPIIAFEQNFAEPSNKAVTKDTDPIRSSTISIGDTEISIQAKYRPDYYHLIQTLIQQDILTSEEVTRIAAIAEGQRKTSDLVTHFNKETIKSKDRA